MGDEDLANAATVSAADALSDAPAAKLHPGTKLGRYVIEGLLGRGGMGEVHRARDTTLQRLVALKVLRADPGQGSTARDASARILREARAAAAFNHPNVVGVYDVGEDEGVQYIAMELVEGRSLRDRAGDDGVPWTERLSWLIDVARALAAAHRVDLVHRDIKPDNVMIREDGTAKVLDFGIAQPARFEVASTNAAALPADLAAFVTLTAEGAVVGTPLYMAPEQMRGGEVDGRTDQFAWGVTAYEVLTGLLPWGAGDVIALLPRVLEADPPSMCDLDPEIPSAVDVTIRRTLAKAGSERFPTMDDVVRALASFARVPAPALERVVPPAAVAADTAKPTALTLAAVPVRRGRRVLVGSLGVAALAVAAAAVAVGLRDSARPPSPSAGSDVPGAVASYREAVALWQSGSSGPARRALARAVAADPMLAPAHLRLALLSETPTEARAHLQKAASHRERLSRAEAALLDAVEPGLVPMPNLEDAAKALARAADEHEGTPEMLIWAARASMRRGEIDAGRVMLDAAMRAEPALRPAALAMAGGGERERYRPDAASAAFDACLQASPRASDCLAGRVRVRGLSGECAAMERDTHAWIAADPEDPAAFGALAMALDARDAPIESVREALRAKWEKLGPEGERANRWRDELMLDVAAGDLSSAMARAEAKRREIPASAGVAAHFEPAWWLTLSATEAGERETAARSSQDFLARAAAWIPESPREATFGLLFVGVAHVVGATSKVDHDAERARWLDLVEQARSRSGSQTDPYSKAMPWVVGYAASARTAEHAREALAALPAYAPLPGPGVRGTDIDLVIGATYTLVGRPEGLPYLESVVRTCFRLENPFAYLYGQWNIGQARAAAGDLEGARRAWQIVVDRWGRAKPGSVKGSLAAEGLKTLRGP